MAEPVRDRIEALHALLAERIVVIDGAMGTMVQARGLTEADYRGERFKDHPKDLKGNHDVLALTGPDVLEAIHREYLEAGADILETNTFSSNRISQADYGLEDSAAAMSRAAAEAARRAVDQYTADTGRPVWLAGAL